MKVKDVLSAVVLITLRETVWFAVGVISRTEKVVRGNGGRARRQIKCYQCGGLGHIASMCPGNGSGSGRVSASLLSRSESEALPSVVMYVGGVQPASVQRRVLVDTGCSRSIVHVSCCEK